MIRPGKSADAFALADLLRQTYERSRYAGRIGLDDAVARKMFAQAAQRHGNVNEGGMFLMVSEVDDAIDACMLGALSRIYGVCDMLCASDLFLIGRKNCDPRAMGRLIDAYIAWAESCPKIHEIGLSWSDSVPGNERIRKVYERRGFRPCATTYRRAAAFTGVMEREIAA